MITQEQLFKELTNLFKKEEIDMKENNFEPKTSLDIKEGSKTRMHISPENKIQPNVPNIHLTYENLDLLIKFYESVFHDISLRSNFLDWIIKGISDNELSISNSKGTANCKSTAGLALHFLIRKKELELLYNAVQLRFNNNQSWKDLLEALKRILKFEYHLLNETDLDMLEKIINEVRDFYLEGRKSRSFISPMDREIVPKHLQILRELIIDVRHGRFQKKIAANFNYEINQDKETVQKYIITYGFNPNLAEILNKIDEDYYRFSEDEFDIGKSQKPLKLFFQLVLGEVLKKIESKTGKKPQKEEKTEKRTATKHNFIADTLKFLKGQKQIMRGLNDTLNVEGSHSFLSKKEGFRLTRNFTIEFALFIFRKLEKLLNESIEETSPK